MRTALAFLRRDGQIMLSYRAAFVMQLFSIFLAVPMFFYIGRVVGNAKPEMLEKYGGNYFAFLLIGAALLDYLSVSLGTFSRSLRESQLMGTLDIVLLSPTRLWKVLAFSSLWAYLFSTIRFSIYLVLGLVFGISLGSANFVGALLFLVLGILSFVPFGIFSASVIMLIKHGNFINAIVSAASLFLGGVLFPSEVLPAWLEPFSALVPLTHAAEGMRQSLLVGTPLSELWVHAAALTGFIVVLLPFSMAVFAYAVRQTKTTGSIAHY